MLLHLALLLPTIALFALSLLTWVRVPVVVPWRTTVLTGEYGHVLACLAGGWGVLTCVGLGEMTWFGMGGLLISGGAVVAFLRPIAGARRISRRLPDLLALSFGSGELRRPVFSVGKLFAARPQSIPCATHEFAPGLKLDFRRAVNREGAAPCVIMIHGGGWDSGGRVEIPFFNDWLSHQGYATAAIEYRLAPEHLWPAQRDDVLSALDWLKTHATELGIDPQCFVLMGRSAGGQIASAVGYTARDPDIRGVISLYAPHDMPFAWSVSRSDDALNSERLMRQYLGGPPDTPEREERYFSASGHLNIDPERPMPTLLMHGCLDTLVWYRHSERFSASLEEAGHPHVFIELPWATHAFEYNLSGPSGQLTTYAVRRFLDSVTAIKSDS